MQGKLIVLEGTDGSGKTTQLELLCRALDSARIPYRKLEFPCYGEPSSTLVRMYLSGEFGREPGDVNAYAASSFYACDRYASYRLHWQREYEEGGLFVAGRYTTSNAVHQTPKLPEGERCAFLDWLFDYEYRLLGLPAPDAVLFFDMPPDLALQNLRAREAGAPAHEGDIHEHDGDYLRRCYECALDVVRRYGWTRIPCAPGGRLLAPGEIHRAVLGAVRPLLPPSHTNLI